MVLVQASTSWTKKKDWILVEHNVSPYNLAKTLKKTYNPY
jgi:hypothetical protein